MELYKVIRNVINTNHINDFDMRFVNILNDFSAYQDYSSAKYIYKIMAEDGFMRQFVNLGTWNSESERMASQFAKRTGFQLQNVIYSFKSLAYGLGWIDESTLMENLQNEANKGTSEVSETSKTNNLPLNKPIQRTFFGVELLSTRNEAITILQNKGIEFEDRGGGSITLHECSFGGVDWTFAILSFNEKGHFCSIVLDAMFGSYYGGSSEVRTYAFLHNHLKNAYSQYLTFEGSTDIGFADGHTTIQLELKVGDYGTSVNLYYIDKEEDEPKKGFEDSSALEL